MQGKIYIITHKRISIPMIQNLKEYEIIQTGDNNAPDLGYLNAASGENIAEYNAYYADLTVHYWLWKNVTCDYVGINHYCRFLTYQNYLMNQGVIEQLLSQYDILLPQRNVEPETVREHWNHFHVPRDLILAFYSMADLYPDYVDSFEEIMKRKEFYICNIMITRKALFNAYCEWVFPILERVRTSIDLNEYQTAYAKRVGGFLSERLFNVWLYHNHLSSYELGFVCVDKNQFDI